MESNRNIEYNALAPWLEKLITRACDINSPIWSSFMNEAMDGSKHLVSMKYGEKRFSELSPAEQANVIEMQYQEVKIEMKCNWIQLRFIPVSNIVQHRW